ncbi:spliceosome-associated protein CWC15 homolog isoform X1 [Clytia hemisphaerica]|uniref:spliceosome-associated protein CWC15 homolog isoform X1 n=1 Tax=Clytia hemisphaerica TaxID=252671 RepID=UPI0034D4DA4A|eukprot:TCONS_00052815-protein
MTTAARPTFDTARGGQQRGEGNLASLTKQYSARDLPSHTKIKTRQIGQDTAEEIRSRDFKHDLMERERSSREKSKKGSSNSSDYSSSSKRQRLDYDRHSSHHHSSAAIDADDPVDDEDEDDSDDDSDDDDDTAELLAELQRIKRDRAEEMLKQEQEKRTEDERIRTENLISGNPLLNQNQQQEGDFKVTRRWDDDVVFKNCAKDDDKPKNSGFINDTIRSEFHKKFMDKYIK